MIAQLPFRIFLGLLALTGLVRFCELWVSYRRIRGRRDAVVPEPWLFPAMALLHVGLLALPAIEVLVFSRPFIPSLAIASLAILAAATALRVWALRSLGQAWNVRIVRPDESVVVVNGPYAFVRHPNYLAVILEIAALPLFHSAWLSALALSSMNAFVLYHRIRNEEKTLCGITAWQESMRDRPRLIPWLF